LASRWNPGVTNCVTEGPGLATLRESWNASEGDRRANDRLSAGQRAFNRCQAGRCALMEQAIGRLANAWALRRWREALDGCDH
jgi:hypothetical protein